MGQGFDYAKAFDSPHQRPRRRVVKPSAERLGATAKALEPAWFESGPSSVTAGAPGDAPALSIGSGLSPASEPSTPASPKKKGERATKPVATALRVLGLRPAPHTGAIRAPARLPPPAANGRKPLPPGAVERGEQYHAAVTARFPKVTSAQVQARNVK
jgi:hypothetical protein